MSALSNACIVEALLRAETIPPPSVDLRLERAIEVHRNTVRHALLAALRETFPAVRVAVDEDYFDALAAEFVAAHPPRSPVMQEYGGDFASFIDDFVPLQDWPWLADLARIDWARREAYHAADADPMAASELLALDPAALLAMRLELHPSLRLLESPHPLASLWFAHQQDDADDGAAAASAEIAWQAEACRVWRMDERVRVRRVSTREAAVLRALIDGRSLLCALWDGHAGEIDQAGTIQWFRQLIDDRLIVAMHPPAIHDTPLFANDPE